MSKRELIDAILQYNRTAAPEFLAKFQEKELEAYLSRVEAITPARVRSAIRASVASQASMLAV
jgi:hypothetical protein